MGNFKIGDFKPKNELLLAPMSEYTDRSFRRMAVKFDAGLAFTEMIHATWLTRRNPKTMDIARVDGGPTVYQLVGSFPDHMREAAMMLESAGARIIDLNMGCPDADLKAMGAGVYLMNDLDKARRIVKAVVDAVKVPVTVKIRLGVNQENINCRRFALALEHEGVSAITLHPRTGIQRLTGPSYWYYIRELKQALHIPVIGNGDIQTPEDAKYMLRSTKCDAVMIGRGALRTPYLFRQVARFLADGTRLPEQNFKDRCETVKEHADLLVRDKGHGLGMQWVRRFLPFYMSDFKKPHDLVGLVKGMGSLKDVERVLERIGELNKSGLPIPRPVEARVQEDEQGRAERPDRGRKKRR